MTWKLILFNLFAALPSMLALICSAWLCSLEQSGWGWFLACGFVLSLLCICLAGDSVGLCHRK